MPNIVLDDRLALYEKLTVEIQGKVYKVKPITQQVYDKIMAMEADKDADPFTVPYKQMKFLLGNNAPVEKWPIGFLQELIMRIISHALKPDEVEKNVQRPGGGESQ